jgi:hypothetical protein
MDKYRPRVEAARASGYQIILVFVSVRLAALNVGRVANRFLLGCHNVPRDRIEARRARSFAMFPWFAERSDIVMVFGNSGPSPRTGAVRGPAGWLAGYFVGTPGAGSAWMMLDMASLDPGLAARARAMAKG